MSAHTPLSLGHRARRPEIAAAICGAVALAGLGLIAFVARSWSGRPLPGMSAACETALVVMDLVIATLLCGQGGAMGDTGATRIGAAYLFNAVLIIIQWALFGSQAALLQLRARSDPGVWVWAAQHGGFAVILAHYALGRRGDAARNWLAWLFSAEWLSARISVRIAGVAIAALLLGLAVGDEPARSATDGAIAASDAWLPVGLGVLTAHATALGLLVGLRVRARGSTDLWLAISMLAACLDIVLTLTVSTPDSAGWYVARGAAALSALAVLVPMMHNLGDAFSQMVAANGVLAGLALVDALTGLANRRRFDAALVEEWRRGLRDQQPLSLLMIDIDRFKSYNDLLGHQRGDECLRAVGRVLAQAGQRPADLVARFGGEEFVVLLPATPLRGAEVIAQRVLTSIRRAAMQHPSASDGIVTVSIGVASIVPRANVPPDVLVAIADSALYDAKNLGRNRIVIDPNRGRGILRDHDIADAIPEPSGAGEIRVVS